MLNGIKLKTKVLCLIAILGALSPIAAAFTYVSLREQAVADELAMNTKSGQTYLERINGLVYAIVMDSRGIYMSSDWDSAKKYGDGILKSAKRLDETASLWAAQVVPIGSRRARRSPAEYRRVHQIQDRAGSPREGRLYDRRSRIRRQRRE